MTLALAAILVACSTFALFRRGHGQKWRDVGGGHYRAQYGYTDPLCPWRDFEEDRSCKVNRECEFGYIRHQGYQSYGMFPVRYIVAQRVEKEELTKALEEKIPLLAKERGGKLIAILRGSDAAFEKANDEFLNQLEGHLRTLMAELYTPEQITRRNKEIECQLSKNMADPDRHRRLDGMIRFMGSAIGAEYGIHDHVKPEKC